MIDETLIVLFHTGAMTFGYEQVFSQHILPLFNWRSLQQELKQFVLVFGDKMITMHLALHNVPQTNEPNLHCFGTILSIGFIQLVNNSLPHISGITERSLYHLCNIFLPNPPGFVQVKINPRPQVVTGSFPR